MKDDYPAGADGRRILQPIRLNEQVCGEHRTKKDTPTSIGPQVEYASTTSTNDESNKKDARN